MFVRPGSIVMGLVKEIGLVNRTDSLVILGSVKEDLLFLIFDSVLILYINCINTVYNSEAGLVEMITPVFKLDQTDSLIILDILAKYSKASSAEIVVSGNLVVFNAAPYYLRIRLSGELQEEDDLIRCTYDIDTGRYTVSIQKKIPGEQFTGLDMIVKLLQKEPVGVKPELIEAMDGDDDFEEDEEDNIESWEIDQQVVDTELVTAATYGFANRKADIFQKLSEEAMELFDKVDIAITENQNRTKLRIDWEQK